MAALGARRVDGRRGEGGHRLVGPSRRDARWRAWSTGSSWSEPRTAPTCCSARRSGAPPWPPPTPGRHPTRPAMRRRTPPRCSAPSSAVAGSPPSPPATPSASSSSTGWRRSSTPGVRYTERQVNARLRPFHDDVAALRRYLVDDGFLDREAGHYWRTGGAVDLRLTRDLCARSAQDVRRSRHRSRG